MERVVNGGDESPSRGRTFRSSFERKTPGSVGLYTEWLCSVCSKFYNECDSGVFAS